MRARFSGTDPMLLNARQLDLHVGTHAILDQAELVIEPRERVCLVGRNGAGKSTLLKVIAGTVEPDSGEVDRSNAPVIATLPQEVPDGLTGTVYDVVALGLGDAGRLVAEYHDILVNEPENLDRMARVQQAIEAVDGWTLSSRVEATLSRLSLDGDRPFAALSGGLKRRVLLAQALVCEPDLLLLDEPTNHLDIDSIRWLEEFLLGWDGTLLFITHDRAFLKRLATRIIELDRGRLTSWPGSYDDYLRRKAEALEAEAQQNALFDKKLAQEETWIRQGIKARRTRNEGRVRALKALRAEYQQRRTVQGTAKIAVEEAERSGKLVTEVTDLRYAFGDLCIVDGLTTTILRGDKIGVLGPNGVGKTTLLRLMLGQLQPDAGTVELGTKLEIAVFDQLRDQLDPTKTVVDHIGDGKETVTIGGKEKHVISYLADFLFPPDRARSPVRVLSGGERSRLMLARLFSRPSNLMILDEPTNDLDVETLELLEERLIEYAGTVIVVSHDRAFVDNVVTRTLAFEGGGRVGDYVGGSEDWLRHRVSPKPRPAKSSAQSGAATQPAAGPQQSHHA